MTDHEDKPRQPVPSGSLGDKDEQEVIRIPIIEERLHVGKHVEETGKVRISKSVTKEMETVDVSLLKQDVQIERIPVNKYVEGAAPAVRQEGDVMVIPVVKEVLVVEKRLMLVEEIRVSRQESLTQKQEQHELRKEEIHIERTAIPGDDPV